MSKKISDTKLQTYSDKICNTYSKYLNGNISQPEASESIGFLLSYLKQYEKEEGLDPDRIICVLPNCAQIIKLRIKYNMESGPAIWRLDVEPQHIGGYNIVNNSITEEDTHNNIIPDSNSTFFCTYKNRSCCYLNKTHDNNHCKECCIGKVHTTLKH